MLLHRSTGWRFFTSSLLLLIIIIAPCCFAFTVRPNFRWSSNCVVGPKSTLIPRHVGVIIILNEDDDDKKPEEPEEEEEEEEDEEPELPDPYLEKAQSEFTDSAAAAKEGGGDLVFKNSDGAEPTTKIDWGGALGKLRQRVEDVESGKSQDPSQVLFRLMSSESPNQAIGNFVQTASPQVVQAMSGAVGSLLGGLASPMSGIETIVKATGDKVASLCFQLQMTGYLFRNAEYVMALKDLMKLNRGATLQEYKDAFDRLDTDRSGYIEASEIESLLDDVYDGETPDFEIKAFLEFFDTDKDGKVSWEEFQRGIFGVAENVRAARQNRLLNSFALPGGEDEDDMIDDIEPHVTGQLEIQLEDGKVVKVDAEEYIATLKAEARALKEALKREQQQGMANPNSQASMILGPSKPPNGSDGDMGGIAGFLASRQGDVKGLTEGISPEIVKTMQMLVDFVLEGGESQKAKNVKKEEMEMVIPSPALQQLALWQLVLGYRLREAEAKGEYLKLME